MTLTQADPRCETMVATLKSGDFYAFINLAERYLRDVPDDVDVLELAVKTYAALGLASPAHRLVQQAALDAADHDRLTEVIPARQDRRPWSSLASQFDANLDAFDRRTGLGTAVAETWRGSRQGLRLLAGPDGGWQIFSQLPDTPGWLPTFAAHHHLLDADKLRADCSGKFIPTIAINGLGLGYLARGVIEATRETYLTYSAPVLIIEPSLLAWAVVLHLFDWRGIFAQPRVRLCAGPDALVHLDEELANVEQQVPKLLRPAAPWPGGFTEPHITERLAAALDHRTRTQHEQHQRVEAIYANRDAAWWARRFTNAGKSEPPLTVYGITCRFTTVLQYSMRDWLAAFEALGHRTYLHIEATDHAQFSPTRVLREIERERPDLILCIDHLQHESPNTYPEHLPYVCWIQDSLPHLFAENVGRKVRPFEFVIGHGFPQALTRFGYPAERFFPCVIPTNPQQLLDPNECPEDLEPYRCDVMFASNPSGTPSEHYQQRRQRFAQSDAAGRLFDAAYEMLMQAVREPGFCGDYDYAGLIEKAQAQNGLHLADHAHRDRFQTDLQALADAHLRERTVRAAAKWANETGGRLHLYGRGWDKIEEFAPYARGFVPHGPQLGRAFRAAKISLHAGCNPALHQRVLDGLCAGGFFLIEAKPSDMVHALNQAIFRHIKANDLEPPFTLRPVDLPEPHATEFRRFLAIRGTDPNRGIKITREMVWNVRAECEGKCRHSASSLWPHYPRVVYHGPAELTDRIEYFIKHDDERRELACHMRAAVLETLTYPALTRSLLAFVGQALTRKAKEQ